jgi:uncharacterized alpha-E superfamily protein
VVAALRRHRRLASGLRQLARVASHLRERLSLDNWRALNRMTRSPGRGRRSAALAELLAELDGSIAGFTALSGYALDGMTRDPGWRFLSIGRRLERLQTLSTTLRQALDGPQDVDLTWLLRLADSIITYRARYSTRPQWLPVLDLLVCDEANPRSIAFQVRGLHDYVRRPARRERAPRAAARRVLRRRLPPGRAARPSLLQPRRRVEPANVCHVIRLLEAAT